MFTAQGLLPRQTLEKKAPGLFLLSHAHRISTDTVLVANDMERAVCWFYKRDNVYIIENAGELAYGMTYHDARHRLLSIDGFKEILARERGKGRVVLITDTGHYARYRSRLPKPAFQEIKGDFAFVQY